MGIVPNYVDNDRLAHTDVLDRSGMAVIEHTFLLRVLGYGISTITVFRIDSLINEEEILSIYINSISFFSKLAGISLVVGNGYYDFTTVVVIMLWLACMPLV